MSETRTNQLLGQNALDFQERLDIARLKRERLERLRNQMVLDGLGGMLLFDLLNIRYATGLRFSGTTFYRMFLQCAIVPVIGDPVVMGPWTEDGSYGMETGTPFICAIR